MAEIRLVKAAAELNVSVQTIVESLQKKGFAIENKPTAKLNDEMYQYVSNLFVSDKAAKEESKSQGLKLKKREDIVKVEEPVQKKVVEVVETPEEPEVLIKNIAPVKEVVKEELQIEIEVGELVYFNDFHQVSAFNPQQQLFSFYYFVHFNDWRSIEVNKHTIPLTEDGEKHRWMHLSEISAASFNFLIDKIVAEKLKESF